MLDRASALLDECPPDQRGWEWHYLNRAAPRPLQKTRVLNPWSPHVAFNSEGQPLAFSIKDRGPQAQVTAQRSGAARPPSPLTASAWVMQIAASCSAPMAGVS